MAWPFQKPVDGDDITDYYDQIKEPMGKNLSFFNSYTSPLNYSSNHQFTQ